MESNTIVPALLGLFIGLPLMLFVILFLFSPKSLAGIFNSIARCETIPAKRLNKFILYGLLLVACMFVAIGFIMGLCHLIKLVDYNSGTALLSDERVIIVSELLGFALYFPVFYCIRKRKGLTLRASMSEAVYSLLLIFTLAIVGVGLFYIGVIVLCIGLALLILGLCFGGVGDSVKVSDGGFFSSSKKLTRGLDGEWRDGQGKAYEKTGRNEWSEK